MKHPFEIATLHEEAPLIKEFNKFTTIPYLERWMEKTNPIMYGLGHEFVVHLRDVTSRGWGYPIKNGVNYGLGMTHRNYEWDEVDTTPATKRYTGFVHFMGGVENFGHFFYNILPKFMTFEKMNNPTVAHVFTGKLPNNWQRLVTAVTNHRCKYTYVPEECMFDGWFASTTNYRGHYQNNLVCVNPESIHWLRTRLRTPYYSMSPYYVSRRFAKHRRVVNEDEVVAELKKLDFQIIEFEDMDLQQQLRLVSNAKLAVIPMGAASPFCGILAPHGATLIDLCPATMYGEFGTRAWSTVLGNVADRVVGKVVNEVDDYEIDVGKVVEKVRKVLA